MLEGSERWWKNERGSFECEESDILMPRFVSPIKLSKLGLDPPTSPIIYRTFMKLSYSSAILTNTTFLKTYFAQWLKRHCKSKVLVISLLY